MRKTATQKTKEENKLLKEKLSAQERSKQDLKEELFETRGKLQAYESMARRLESQTGDLTGSLVNQIDWLRTLVQNLTTTPEKQKVLDQGEIAIFEARLRKERVLRDEIGRDQRRDVVDLANVHFLNQPMGSGR